VVSSAVFFFVFLREIACGLWGLFFFNFFLFFISIFYFPGAHGRVYVFWGDARWSRAQLLGEIARGHWGLCRWVGGWVSGGWCMQKVGFWPGGHCSQI
jgi:hypothetical protein